MSQDEEAQRLRDARAKALWGEQSRLRTAQNKGRIEGKQEEKFETVANSIEIGLTDEQISKITGLPISEIKKHRVK